MYCCLGARSLCFPLPNNCLVSSTSYKSPQQFILLLTLHTQQNTFLTKDQVLVTKELFTTRVSESGSDQGRWQGLFYISTSLLLLFFPLFFFFFFFFFFSFLERESQTDRQSETDREKETHSDRERGRDTERQTHTVRETDRQEDRQTERGRRGEKTIVVHVGVCCV